MFKGFKLKGISFGDKYESYYNAGLENYHSYEKFVHDTLESYFLNNKQLDGTKIIESWFPKLNCHVFLSHSHNDKNNVIALAGWLKETFELDSFIDSCIWGYSNDLIQILDNEYSWLRKEQFLYDYKKILFSTSHVHMMLSTALNSMIDKCECLVFYDTANSVQNFESINRTNSPWVYSEIAFSELVRKKKPERIKNLFESRRDLSEKSVFQMEKSLDIAYELEFKHLIEINSENLNEWEMYSLICRKEQALDKLYELTCPVTKTIK